MQASSGVKTPQDHRNDVAASVAQKCEIALRAWERTGEYRHHLVWAQMTVWHQRLVSYGQSGNAHLYR